MERIKQYGIWLGMALTFLGLLFYTITFFVWLSDPAMAVDSKYHSLYHLLVIVTGLVSLYFFWKNPNHT